MSDTVLYIGNIILKGHVKIIFLHGPFSEGIHSTYVKVNSVSLARHNEGQSVQAPDLKPVSL